jgi:ppGpp synthetase/RelA/SpoT-type nucleotidyltranferase
MENIKDVYTSNFESYKKAKDRLIELVQYLILEKHIQVHEVTGRVKAIDSFLEKANNYSDPLNEITDYIGIRIVTYVIADVESVCNILNEEFEIDTKRSVNKGEQLGIDKIGYSSIHFIAKLNKKRITLPEYIFMNKMCFEIQIKTILQHTWAEIEHDRKYKFHGVLPTNIKRNFNLLSAVLEVVDNQFNIIASEIDKYEKNVHKDIMNNELEIEITTTSVYEFVIGKYGKYLDIERSKIIWPQIGYEVVNELLEFGIKTLADIKEIESNEYLEELEKEEKKEITIMGLLRFFMILKDYKKYFEKSWKEKWTHMKKERVDYLLERGIDIYKEIAEKK